MSFAVNLALCVTDVASRSPFSLLATDRIADLHLAASTDTFQCFPLFQYGGEPNQHPTGEDLTRQDNITSKSLTLLRIFYNDDTITRKDIFYYIYALLHHPAYRTRYAENLKRELPRIPFVGVPAKAKPASATFFPLAAVEKMQGDAKPNHNPQASAKLFHAFAEAGQMLADLHINYESTEEYPLARRENPDAKLDWRVEAMKLTKDKTSLIYNDFLTLDGIPPETFTYRLGNRSALEWVIDQYRVSSDDLGHITSDPNRPDDEQYILRLIGQVITVSLETQKIISTLPPITFE